MYFQGAQLGLHPEDGAAVTLETGKWGPYVKHASTMASLPKARLSAGVAALRGPSRCSLQCCICACASASCDAEVSQIITASARSAVGHMTGLPCSRIDT